MKGLSEIPCQKKLLQAYKALQFSIRSRYGQPMKFYKHKLKKKNDGQNYQSSSHLVETKKLALWSQWVRLDPRLGEIMIQYLFQVWPSTHPALLNKELKKQVWPSAFGVLIEHLPYYYSKKLKSKKWDKAFFQEWSECVMSDITPAPNEQFFIGLYKAGGKKMREECLYSLKLYRKWGYFAKDLLINKANKSLGISK